MKTKRLDFNYRSLALAWYIDQIGSIPTRQSYDAVSGEYAPDYTLQGSHLVFQPHVSVVSEEPGAEHGDVTTSEYLTNIRWTEITTSTQTVITASNPNYELTTSGPNKCRIVMKRNVPAASSLTLVFECDYLDARKNETHHVRDTVKVSCETEGTMPVLSIDKPTTNLYNPFRDSKVMTFNAHLRHEGVEVPTAQREFVWEKKRADGSWTAIGSDEEDDFGWSVTNDGATYTQNMDYIGEKQDMRVRAAFGNVTIEDVNESLAVYFTMVRRLPDFDYDYKDVADEVEPETENVYPVSIVTDREGIVPNNIALQELTTEWYTAAGVATGQPTMELVATEPEPVISTDKVNRNGMIIGLEMRDRGNWKKTMQDGVLVTETINGVEYIVVAK